jgi:hypothetical protein
MLNQWTRHWIERNTSMFWRNSPSSTSVPLIPDASRARRTDKMGSGVLRFEKQISRPSGLPRVITRNAPALPALGRGGRLAERWSRPGAGPVCRLSGRPTWRAASVIHRRLNRRLGKRWSRPGRPPSRSGSDELTGLIGNTVTAGRMPARSSRQDFGQLSYVADLLQTIHEFDQFCAGISGKRLGGEIEAATKLR